MSESVLFDRVQLALSAAPDSRDSDDVRMVMSWCRDLSRAESKKGKLCVLGELDDAVLMELVKHSTLEQQEYGHVLIRQGAEGDRMYIVLAGSLEARIQSESSVKEGDVVHGGSREFTDALGIVVGVVGCGGVIGEVALVRSVKRTANVIVSSSSGCTLIRISRQLYQRTLQSRLEELEREREEFAHSFHLVSNFNPRLKQQFVRALMKERYYNGDIIVRQGDSIDDVCFVVSGEVLLHVNTKQLTQQYELHLQARNVYAILPTTVANGSASTKSRLHHSAASGSSSNSSSSSSSSSSNNNGNGSKFIWSCVSRHAILGDFEILSQLPSRMATATAQTETILFRMNLQEFRRLVLREGRETAKEARLLAKTALKYRNEMRKSRLQPDQLRCSEVAFVDYIIKAIDSTAMPS